jgi:hypothetical protein
LLVRHVAYSSWCTSGTKDRGVHSGEHVRQSWRTRFAEMLGARTMRIGPSYVARITVAAGACLAVARLLHIANPIWAVVSAVVVIFPEVKNSVSSAALRVVANFIGAASASSSRWQRCPRCWPCSSGSSPWRWHAGSPASMAPFAPQGSRS